jgi:hypothetical protein
MRKTLLVTTLILLVPSIASAETGLFETKPKHLPDMVQPDVEVKPYDKTPFKDYMDVTKPEQPPLEEANPAPRVVKDSIDCYGEKIKVFVEFDKGLPKKKYGGAIEYFTTDSNINHIFATWDLYDGAKTFTSVVPPGTLNRTSPPLKYWVLTEWGEIQGSVAVGNIRPCEER